MEVFVNLLFCFAYETVFKAILIRAFQGLCTFLTYGLTTIIQTHKPKTANTKTEVKTQKAKDTHTNTPKILKKNNHTQQLQA